MSLDRFSNQAYSSSSRDEHPTATFHLGMYDTQNLHVSVLPKFSVPQPSPATPFELVDCMSMIGDFGYTVNNFAEKPFTALISPN